MNSFGLRPGAPTLMEGFVCMRVVSPRPMSAPKVPVQVVISFQGGASASFLLSCVCVCVCGCGCGCVFQSKPSMLP